MQLVAIALSNEDRAEFESQENKATTNFLIDCAIEFRKWFKRKR